MKALEVSRDLSDLRLIAPLIEVYAGSDSEEIRAHIRGLLYDLRGEPSVEPLMEALRAPRLEKSREFILTVFWNSGLQPVNHIRELVQLAISGTYMETLEVLTVLDSLETTPPEHQVAGALDDVSEALDHMRDQHRANLLQSIRQVLEGMLARGE